MIFLMGDMGNQVLNTTAGLFSAVAFFLKSAIAFVTSNPLLLGFTVVVLLTANLQARVGRSGVSFKGRSGVRGR